MTFDSPNTLRRNDRIERDNACSEPAREDLSRHVQKLFDEKLSSCCTPQSADRYLPPYSNEYWERGGAPDQSRFGGVVDQLRQHRTRLLLDASAPPEHRLAAVRELAHSGTGDVTIRVTMDSRRPRQASNIWFYQTLTALNCATSRNSWPESSNSDVGSEFRKPLS